MSSLLCGIKTRNKINEQTKLSKNKYVDKENRAVVTRREGTVGREK